MINVWLNGAVVAADSAQISVGDRGFLLGDGFFETMRVENGTVAWLAAHHQRLLKNAQILRFPTEALPTIAVIRDAISLLKEQAPDTAVARLTVSRGVAARGLVPNNAMQPTLLITLQPFVASNQPLHLITSRQVRRNPWSIAARVKSCNYIDGIMAAYEAVDEGADDALLLSVDGLAAETTKANIFALKDGILYSPGTSKGALEGIARSIILRDVATLGLVFGGEVLSLENIIEADAVFVSNALSGVQRVSALDHKPLVLTQEGKYYYKMIAESVINAIRLE